MEPTESDLTHQLLVEKFKALSLAHQEWIHPPTKTCEESAKARGLPLDWDAKAMMIKAGDQFLLFVLSGKDRINWKNVKNQLKCKKVEMAKEEDVMKISKCLPGAVPPFGSLFGITTYVDNKLIKDAEFLHFNAGLRTCSWAVKKEDYLVAEKPLFIDVC